MCSLKAQTRFSCVQGTLVFYRIGKQEKPLIMFGADDDAPAMRYECAILCIRIRIRIRIHIRIRIRLYAVLCQAASALHFCLWLHKSNNETNWKTKLTIQ